MASPAWWVIAKREFSTRVKTKWFAITTLLGPIMMVGLIVIPALLFFVMPIAIGINLATPYLALTLLVLAARAAGLRFDTALASVGLRRILQPVPLALPGPVRSATETQR